MMQYNMYVFQPLNPLNCNIELVHQLVFKNFCCTRRQLLLKMKPGTSFTLCNLWSPFVNKCYIIYKRIFILKIRQFFIQPQGYTCSSVGAVKNNIIPSSKINYKSFFQFQIRNQLIYVIQIHEYIQTKIIVHV